MKWFNLNVSFLKNSNENVTKTTRVITSWITFNSTSVKSVFEQGDSPAYQNNTNQRQGIKPFHFLEFQMAVPGKSHKRVR
jgi:hypothetical protein